MSKVGNKFSSGSSMSKVGSKFSSGSSTSKAGSKFSSGSTSPVRTTSVPRSSSSGAGTSTAGRTTNALGNFFILILVIILVVAYALLQMPIQASIILFVLSAIGIVVSMMVSKPEITPEDKLRETTINEFQVPNTKAALLEFTLLATQKIQPVSSVMALFDPDAKRQVWLNKIWTEKCRGIYNRATVAMQGDSSSLNQITNLMAKAGVKV